MCQALIALGRNPVKSAEHLAGLNELDVRIQCGEELAMRTFSVRSTASQVQGTAPVIVIPAYNAAAALDRCLRSVFRHTPKSVRIHVIDDASTDPRVRRILSEASVARPEFVVERHDTRRGYVRSANRGLGEAGERPVFLLNSDTVVTSGWIEKMMNTSESEKRVATVTPVSNCAGPFSIPVRGRCNKLPKGVSIDTMGSVVESVSPQRRPRVPTGHGFCMLIRPEAHRDVGLFDNVRFGRGYGEENDFCLRASAAGFIHLVDDATFIYHEGGASFGRWLKPLRMNRAYRLLRRLHPGYHEEIAAWLADDPLAELRARVARSLTEQRDAR